MRLVSTRAAERARRMVRQAPLSCGYPASFTDFVDCAPSSSGGGPPSGPLYADSSVSVAGSGTPARPSTVVYYYPRVWCLWQLLPESWSGHGHTDDAGVGVGVE